MDNIRATAFVIGTHILQFAGTLALYSDEEWEGVLKLLVEILPPSADTFNAADRLRETLVRRDINLDGVAKDFPKEEA